jgi:DNA-binding NarL/FixJ family response regulator
MITLLIVDDHALVRAGLKAFLRYTPDMKVTFEADSGLKALELYTAHKPDIVLLDIRMNEPDGIDTLRLIRKEDPEAKVIMLTTSNMEEDIYQSLQSGAKGYIMKDALSDMIADAIRTVHAGGTVFPEHILSQFKTRSVQHTLSRRQLDVLGLMAKGFSNREIARLTQLSESTVLSYNTIIFEKLSVSGRAEAVAVALQRGIIKTT